MSECKAYVRICYTIKEVQRFAYDYCQNEENFQNIKRIDRRYPIKITLRDDTEIFIMTFKTYETWCKGRTYYIYNTDALYHSDYLIRQERD